ncbi:phage virion morphogenesis protein [Methyloversatilis sp. XJ19-49]|uniref:phage virion morphogenesis protein n=1 Tax=Methyloversatilis sp. XJ19-49 TaxID=2963429 RepID=UPI00211C0913|nr:phage virion morphogenesis protein [Methyloversatilis sp. XJ19-49]MCQ9378803.1 phage virion morphogenesis protein [Methyloversatilis sp. XJ19-49]
MSVTVDVDGDGAQKKLQRLISAGQSAELYDSVGAGLKTLIDLGFKFSRDPYGQQWAPLKFRGLRRSDDGGKISRTGRRQAQANRSGRAGQPLRDTGRLQRSITYQAAPDGVTVGTNLRAKSGASIAAVHQFGAVILPKKGKYLIFPGPNGALIFAKKSVIPRRAFLPLDKTGILALPTSWVTSIVARIRAFLLRKAS